MHNLYPEPLKDGL